MQPNLFVRRLDGAVPLASSERAPLEFHRSLPGYAPTPLREVPEAARALGVAQVQVKDESARLGLEAFKVLGASWAIVQTLLARAPLSGPRTHAALAAHFRSLAPLTLRAATEGNHGRAVARVARWYGLSARLFVSEHLAPRRVQVLEAEGAQVVRVKGGYDAAVAEAAKPPPEPSLLIADITEGDGPTVADWVTEGYGTLFLELDEVLPSPPTAVAVPMGVGALAAALVRHYDGARPRPLLVGVEPEGAPCVTAALEQGAPVSVPTTPGVMAGLVCGTASARAFPLLRRGLDVSVAIADAAALEAQALLGRAGVRCGAAGAAGLAGLLALSRTAAGREALGPALGPTARLLAVVTEGQPFGPPES